LIFEGFIDLDLKCDYSKSSFLNLKSKIMKSIITTFSLVLVSFISLCQTSNYTKLDDFFSVLEDKDRFFGSVAVSRAGEVIYTKSLGYADIETNSLNTIETKFRIGSISKTFTATLIMQTVEQGIINLDDTIERFFPELQNASQITVRQLLNHRSGITNFTDRNYYSWYTKPITQAALLDTIESKGIDFEPGTDYAYSNSNYVLLTFILEDVLGNSFSQILDQYIVNPLGLTNTSYGAKTNPANNEARSYQKKADWTLEPEGDMSIPLGAGGIISTPTDLCLFAEALFNGRLISMESLEQMKPVEGEDYGFALYGTDLDENLGWGHGGNIDAFASSLAYFEDSDIGIALSCNGADYGTHEVAMAIMSEVFGKSYELPSFDFVELSSEELDQYLGIYETDEIPLDLTITKNGTTLMLQATGQSAGPIMAEGNHVFSKKSYGVRIEFVPSEKLMHFEQNGMAFDFVMKEEAEDALETAADEVVDEAMEKRTVEITTVDLDQYVGIYSSEKLPLDLTISREENTLVGQGTGQPAFILETEGDDVFSNKEIGLTINFKPKENKMSFEQGGMAFEMSREIEE